MRRPGASCGGGLSCAATCSRDRWLFTTELGLQAWSHQNRQRSCRAGKFRAAAPFLFLKNDLSRFILTRKKLLPPKHGRRSCDGFYPLKFNSALDSPFRCGHRLTFGTLVSERNHKLYFGLTLYKISSSVSERLFLKHLS